MNPRLNKTNVQKVFETSFYYLVILISVILFLFILKLGLQSFQTSRDLEVFCQAGKVIHNGQNPYLTSDLRLELSWNYPSTMAYGFYVACPFFNLEQNYLWIYALFFLAGLILWLNHKDWLYGIVLCTTALFNLGWVMITGNISTVEFLLFSLSAFLLFKNKINVSAFLFGLMASTKLIPISYLPAFLFFQFDMKKKIATGLWSMIGFLSLPLLSLISSPHLFPSYLRQLFGLIPNQHNPFSEFTPNGLNPSLSIMILSFFGMESQIEKINLIFSLLIYTLSVFVLYLMFKSLSKSTSAENNFILFSLGIVLLTIVMPRLKPYSFLPALLCFYLITRDQNNWLKSAYLVLLSIVPTVLHLIYFYTENIDNLFEKVSPIFLANSLQTILSFHQIFFLSIVAVLLILNVNKKVS